MLKSQRAEVGSFSNCIFEIHGSDAREEQLRDISSNFAAMMRWMMCPWHLHRGGLVQGKGTFLAGPCEAETEKIWLESGEVGCEEFVWVALALRIV